MTIQKLKMRPIQFGDHNKRQILTQFGALCYRVRRDKIQVLLVTSRTTKRWIVPKGWPMPGATPHEAALTEAWEEAGVKGRAIGNSLGIFSYGKRYEGDVLPCVVAVFAVKVGTLAAGYPEVKERKRKWFSRKKAAALVMEPELQHIIRSFDPQLA
ncbi:MAG: NUDIX hydrolase [Pseudomonadota bacterium]